jgi:hypothetical protein
LILQYYFLILLVRNWLLQACRADSSMLAGPKFGDI